MYMIYTQVELYPPLFEVDSFSSAIFRIPKAPPPSLKRPEAFSDGLAAFVARCLQKDPTRRATAAQLLADAFIAPAAIAPLGRPTLLACLKQLARARTAEASATEGQPPALMGMHGIPAGGAELARHGYVDLGISGAADGGASAPPGLPVVYGVPTLMPLGGAGPACYLLFTENRGGALLLQWSETPVDGALAAFVPAKPPPRFKLTANGGQSELKRGVGERASGSSTNLKAFYAAWASFIRAAFASGGPFFFMSNLPTNPVGVYLCQADSSVRKVQLGSCTCNAPHAASMRCTCAWHVHGMRARHAHGMHARCASQVQLGSCTSLVGVSAAAVLPALSASLVHVHRLLPRLFVEAGEKDGSTVSLDGGGDGERASRISTPALSAPSPAPAPAPAPAPIPAPIPAPTPATVPERVVDIDRPAPVDIGLPPTTAGEARPARPRQKQRRSGLGPVSPKASLKVSVPSPPRASPKAATSRPSSARPKESPRAVPMGSKGGFGSTKGFERNCARI